MISSAKMRAVIFPNKCNKFVINVVKLLLCGRYNRPRYAFYLSVTVHPSIFRPVRALDLKTKTHRIKRKLEQAVPRQEKPVCKF